MNSEKLHYLISIIGKERIEKVYAVLKGEKISFAALNKQLLQKRIIELIHAGRSFREIAKECRVSRMTVYRVFRDCIRKKSQK